MFTWSFGLGVHLVFKCGCSHWLALHSDRPVPELDTIVPSESAKAYDMLDIIHSVSLTVFTLKDAYINYILGLNNSQKPGEWHWRYRYCYLFISVFISDYFCLCNSCEWATKSAGGKRYFNRIPRTVFRIHLILYTQLYRWRMLQFSSFWGQKPPWVLSPVPSLNLGASVLDSGTCVKK